MKLAYIANIRLPTEKAHGNQIMEMCNAFSKNGNEVNLIVPARLNNIKDSPFSFHDIPKTFTISIMPCLDLIRFGKFWFYVESFTFTFFAALHVFFNKYDFVYSRDEYIVFILNLLNIDCAWEAHMGQLNFFVKKLIENKTKIVCISEGLRDLYTKNGASSLQLIVAPDGADVDRFDIDIGKEEARERISLSKDKKIILYKGSLGKWKGADTLAKASSLLKTKDAVVVFIGGNEKDVGEFKQEFKDAKNILVLGNRPRKETPIYQKAADVLVIPNSGKEEISSIYTSPMKLFGYMASGVPIVSSDLPSIREVLSEENTFFAKADDEESFASVIDFVLANEVEAQKRAIKAKQKVQKYSWIERARTIIEKINPKG